jgi:hypothetical protein
MACLKSWGVTERRGGGAHMTCHRQRGYKNTEIQKTKGRKKAENKKKKKKGRGKRKKKGRGTGTRISNK